MTAGHEQNEFLDVVDESDRVVGRATRAECLEKGLLHRAVAVLVGDAAGNFLLQKRASTKKINPGRWDASVSGHIAAGEAWDGAANRELEEELGVRLALRCVSHFRIRQDHGGRVENEFVRVYAARADAQAKFVPDAREVEALHWASTNELIQGFSYKPSAYTEFLRKAFAAYAKAEGQRGEGRA